MTGSDRRWRIERHRGDAAALHLLDPPERPARVARVLTVGRPTVVLGSAQSDAVVDAGRAASRGLDVTRRRSGGGAVLLVPGEHVWVDLFVPAGDPLWDDDVVVAADWVGAAWQRALIRLGIGHTTLHRGAADDAPWSRLVCFAGRGPGEVLVGGRKLVGVSQRRTRDWVRAQTAVHLRWTPGRLVEVLSLDADERLRLAETLGDAVATVAVDTAESAPDPVERADQVLGALAAALPD